MSYATLLVHLESGQPNTALLAVAGQFAERFAAHVVGIAVGQPMTVVGGEGSLCGEVFAEDRRLIMADLDAVESAFRAAFHGGPCTLEWRSEFTIAPLADYLSAEARCADLVMTGSTPADPFDLSRVAHAGSLVMQAGRPVLVVPRDTRPLKFERALIGWKDTRECRRAVSAALPLLGITRQVTILEIAAHDDLEAAETRVKDVAAWLRRHGVTADSRVERSVGDDIGQLYAAIDETGTDVVVVGAYGHSRLREWILGGVTHDLLLGATHCVLASH